MNHKYYIIQSSNGTVSIISEWDDLTKAKVAYFDRCKTLWNAPDVIEGYVGIFYSAGIGVADGYIEHIEHTQEFETEEATEVDA